MIRRNPTLIPMNDGDVQTIRNALAQKKAAVAVAAAAAAHADPNVKGKVAAEPSAAPAPFVAAEEAKRQREGMSKDERLDLPYRSNTLQSSSSA
ncbi:hypothetical protein OF83DRAFT_1173332 [Amylostereum chailletii]|nr:hypothetical protein OF83DRAFT_1173332 [Amylostereum chailletii]